MVRKPSLKVIERNEDIVKRIAVIKADHPKWGYRRVWAHLNYIDHCLVNKKRVYRLMKTNGYLVSPNTKLKASRLPKKSKPKPTKPNEWWGIDMTKVMTQTGYAYITIVLDWYTKKVVGHHIGIQSKASHWLEAVDKGLNQQFQNGVEGHALSLMSDNGTQPTSKAFMKACSQLGVKQGFTAYNNPKGNADTERFMRTMKEECLWLNEWENLDSLKQDLEKWLHYYNHQYLHSTLNYQSPVYFEQQMVALLKSA